MSTAAWLGLAAACVALTADQACCSASCGMVWLHIHCTVLMYLTTDIFQLPRTDTSGLLQQIWRVWRSIRLSLLASLIYV
jgi:hypothetical protein